MLIPEKYSKWLENGAVELLVLLLNSNNLNIQLPANRTPEQMIKEYMKTANRKQNFSNLLSDIIMYDNEINPKMKYMEDEVKTTPSGSRAWDLICFNHWSIFESLESIRKIIHRQYTRNSSCISFSRACKRLGCIADLTAIQTHDRAREIFDQLGGVHMLLELLLTLHVFHSNDCMNKACESFILATTNLLFAFSSSRNSLSTDARELSNQLTRSPFHINMFVKLARNNVSNHSALCLLNRIYSNDHRHRNGDALRDGQVIASLTEIMMNTDDLDEQRHIFECLITFVGDYRQRIHGAIGFVIDMFVKNHSWVIDGSFDREDQDQSRKLTSKENHQMSNLRLLHTIVRNGGYVSKPEVQDLYWKAEVSTFLVGLTKLIRADNYQLFFNGYEFPMGSFSGYINWSIYFSFTMLHPMMKISKRELVKVRQLVDIEFFREVSKEVSAELEKVSERKKRILVYPSTILLKHVRSIIELLESVND